jgi:broad specificity phosphatase PhoE
MCGFCYLSFWNQQHSIMARARIHIVRHGETDENRNGIIQGQLDTFLNEDGIEQARRVAEALRDIPFDVAFTSDLSRAVKTAEMIVLYHPEVQLQKIEALRERYMGDLQGKKNSRFSDHSSIEKTELFYSRAVSWWNTSILQYLGDLPTRKDPYNVLIVSHGGWIGTLVRTLINSRKLKTKEGVFVGNCFNTSVATIEIETNGTATVVKYGDISHLIRKVVEVNSDEQV